MGWRQAELGGRDVKTSRSSAAWMRGSGRVWGTRVGVHSSAGARTAAHVGEPCGRSREAESGLCLWPVTHKR